MRIIFILAIILFGIFQLRPGLNGPDSGNYYAIARSISFDSNLMFNNEFATLEIPMIITPTYHILEQHQIGAPLLWAFVFSLMKSIGLDEECFLTAAINFLEYLLGILALMCIFKLLIKFFSQKSALLSIIAVLFGTNLFAYFSLFTGASHVSSVFFVSLFLLFYFNTYQKRNWSDWCILGGLGGLMLLARRETVVYLVFPSFDLFSYLKEKRLKEMLWYGSFFMVSLFFVFSPQLLFWKIVFGKIFRSYGEADFFRGAHFFAVLFSPLRGFISFAPLLFLCALNGLPYVYKKDKKLALSIIFIFLTLIYLTGRAKYGWAQGWSFGGRVFLIFLPLFMICVAATFEKLTFKKQIFITVVSGFWSCFLLSLFVLGRELEFYSDLLRVFNIEFFREVLKFYSDYLETFVFRNIHLKFILLAIVFLLALLVRDLGSRIKVPIAALKRVIIFSVIATTLYINILFVVCYFNDQRMIAKLTEKGFYENAVFGDFDKADVAATYLEFLIGEIRDGRINSAISLIRRAMRLYPPFKDDCFESLYELYTEFPKEFKIYFYKNPDAFDYLGLSIKFSEKNDFNDSRYYFKEALKLKPDILETGIKSHDRYLNKGIAKVADFLNKN